MIGPMYQFSLEYYKLALQRALQRSEKNDVVEHAARDRIADITKSMFTSANCSRALFEKDKMLYAFMMCANIAAQGGDISDAEWAVLHRRRGHRRRRGAAPAGRRVARVRRRRHGTT